jgi:hypothetical protein
VKKLIFSVVILLGLNAKADIFIPNGKKTECSGFVVNPTGQSVPIEIFIQWGGGLYEALTTLTIDGHSGSGYSNFSKTAGNTRCESWAKSTTSVNLDHGLYSYNIEFNSSWNHSGCGRFPNGAFLSDTMPGGPNQMVELTCK